MSTKLPKFITINGRRENTKYFTGIDCTDGEKCIVWRTNFGGPFDKKTTYYKGTKDYDDVKKFDQLLENIEKRIK